MVSLQLRALALSLILALAGAVAPQAQTPTNDSGYLHAIQQSDHSKRVAAIEEYLSTGPAGDRKRDALTILVWEYIKTGSTRRAVFWAKELLETDPDNAIALSALSRDATEQVARGQTNTENALSLARRGIRSLETLPRPEGLGEGDYLAMTRNVRAQLNYAAGQIYLDRQDFLTARKYLKEAVALFPQHGQYAYSAALAYLQGKNPDAQTGYWLLARSVVLTKGTPAGEQIATFARERYSFEGGSNAQWDEFLRVAEAGAPPIGRSRAETAVASAKAPPPPVKPAEPTRDRQAEAPSVRADHPTTRTVEPTRTPPASAPERDTRAAAAPPAQPQPESVPESKPQSPSAADAGRTTRKEAAPPPKPAQPEPAAEPSPEPQPEATAEPETVEEQTAGPTGVETARVDDDAAGPVDIPPVPPAPREEEKPAVPEPPQRPPQRKGAPVSLGILIESRIASRENRVNLIYTLSDMVRRLREDDEAFIVSSGAGVGFEQDLTWNYELLERAMERIEPTEGTALMEAIAFSAGHLARIAKNQNRVLLVISDNFDENPDMPMPQVAKDLIASGTRVLYVGIGAGGESERARLREVTSRTGGKAVFIAHVGNFRSAAREIATGLGMSLP